MDRMTHWGRIVTFGFSLAFGLWAAAQRYTGSFGAGAVSILDAAMAALTVVINLSALALLGAWVYRCYRTRALPKDAVLFVGALLGMEFLWRFAIHDLPGNGFKLVAVAVFFAQPLIAALGVAAAVSALRRLNAAPGPDAARHLMPPTPSGRGQHGNQ